MVASGQTLMAVTAQLPWGRPHPLDRPSHVHDRAAGSRAATAYASQLAASLGESGTKWGRLRRERHGIRGLAEAGVPAAEVAGELVIEYAGADLQ